MWSPKQGFQGWAGERESDVLIPRTSELRLTLTSNTPVTTSDVTAAGALYLTAYEGNLISLPWQNGKTGPKYNVFELPKTPAGIHEISATFLANGPWALVSGSVYDVFCRLGSSGPVLVRGPAWSSATARATDLARDDTGRQVLSTDWSLLWLGTIRASGTNTTEDSGDYTTASSGTPKRFVWNAHNRVQRTLLRMLTADSWDQFSATWRQVNSSAANQFEVVVGQAGVSMIDVTYAVVGAVSVDNDQYGWVAWDIDAATAPDPLCSVGFNGFAPTLAAPCISRYIGLVPLGYHYYVPIEYAGNAGTNAVAWLGDSTVADTYFGSFVGITWA